MAASLEGLEASDHIAHMIDVLKPFFVKHVKCLHLLPYLPFMRAHAAKIQKLERSGDHTGASELFLECLHKYDEEPGRYAAFRDALREAEYDHIARVLEGEAMEENHVEHCKLIEIFTGSIIEKMDPIEMLRHLRHHNLVSESEENEIRNIHRDHSRYDAALTLLDCVHRRKLGWYDKFMSTMLEIYPQLVELVDPHFKEKKQRQMASQLEEFGETDTESMQEPSLTEQTIPKGVECHESFPEEMQNTEEKCPRSLDENNLDKNSQTSPKLTKDVKDIHANADTSNVTDLMSPASVKESETSVVRPLILRRYQEELAGPALGGANTIICAPTGSGKTMVAAKIMKEHLEKRGVRKVIFFANQVVLVEQQYNVIRDFLPRDCRILQLSGENQEKYGVPLNELVMRNDILFMTPQILVDALRDGEVSSVSEFTLLVFDECHHTNLDHPFNKIMFHYMEIKLNADIDRNRKALPQIVGLTASLGVGKARTQAGAVDHILRLCAHLDVWGGVSTVRQHQEDLATYNRVTSVDVKKTKHREDDIFKRVVSDTLMAKIEKKMQRYLENVRETVPGLESSYLHPPVERGGDVYTQWVSKMKRVVADIEDQTARRFYFSCRRMLELYNKSLMLNEDCRSKDALTYLQVELECLYSSIRMDATDLDLKEQFEKVIPVLQDASQNPRCINPKLTALCAMIMETFDKQQESRCMVFVKTRNLAAALKCWMEENPNLSHLKPGTFIGQSVSVEKGGMTRNQQLDAAELFRKGDHKIIVATSIAEEGMDFSQCNLVIRYEYVTNEIAMVQARGRARAEDSQFVVMTSNKHGTAEKEELNMVREEMMYKALNELETKIRNNPQKFQEDILKVQIVEKKDRDHMAMNESERILTEDEHEMRCMKCNYLACFSTDFRTIKKTCHVVISPEFKAKITIKPHPKPCKMGPFMQKKYKIYCGNCGLDWGIAVIYKNTFFPVIKIESLIAINGMGVITRFHKKWNDAPFIVYELTDDEMSSYKSLDT